MKTGLLASLLLACVVATCHATADEIPDEVRKMLRYFPIAQDAFVLPAGLGSFERGPLTEYPYDFLGFSGEYRSPEIPGRMDVYVYPVTLLPDSSAADAVEDAFRQSLHEIEMSHEHAIVGRPAIARSTDGSRNLGLKVHARFLANGVQHNSYLYVGRHLDLLVKVRFSAPATRGYESDTDAIFEALLANLTVTAPESRVRALTAKSLTERATDDRPAGSGTRVVADPALDARYGDAMRAQLQQTEWFATPDRQRAVWAAVLAGTDAATLAPATVRGLAQYRAAAAAGKLDDVLRLCEGRDYWPAEGEPQLAALEAVLGLMASRDGDAAVTCLAPAVSIRF
jgi:hypothetical protein